MYLLSFLVPFADHMGVGNGWDNGHNGFDNGRMPIMGGGMPLGGGNGFDAGFDSGLGAIVDGTHGISKGAHKKGKTMK